MIELLVVFAVCVGIWFLGRWDLRRWWRNQYPWEHCSDADFAKHLVRKEQAMDIKTLRGLSNADLGAMVVAMADGMVEGMLTEKMTMEEHAAALLMVAMMKEAGGRLVESS